ncbi:MAG TPA: hypothetical protein PLO53_11445, partial [Candidatus Hydrogenedentes bacterium]|nr:hypothetical protein [Candidatus Hydrogenedentota bacterium]
MFTTWREAGAVLFVCVSVVMPMILPSSASAEDAPVAFLVPSENRSLNEHLQNLADGAGWTVKSLS